MNAEVIPSVIYTQPEVASVGLTRRAVAGGEAQSTKVRRFPFSA